jgi:hypothetical protein
MHNTRAATPATTRFAPGVARPAPARDQTHLPAIRTASGIQLGLACYFSALMLLEMGADDAQDR